VTINSYSFLFKNEKQNMINLEDSKKIMEEAGLEGEKLAEYEAIIKPFFTFSEYICEKKEVSPEAAEQIFNIYCKKYMIEKTSNVKDLFSDVESEDVLTEKIYEITGEAAEKYALENDYDQEKAEELKESITKLMTFLKENFTGNNENQED
jgi:signal transduction protein with GAF and PtsI domain